MTILSQQIHGDEGCYFCNSSGLEYSSKRRPVFFNVLRFFLYCRECKGLSLYPKLSTLETDMMYASTYISDVNLEEEPYENLNNSRFLNLDSILRNFEPSPQRKFLDYGCGANAEAVLMALDHHFESYGVEVEASTREKARNTSSCQIFSPNELPTLDLKFDCIFLGDVLEHLSDPQAELILIHNLLLPTGFLVMQGPLEAALTISNILIAVKARFLRSKPSIQVPYHVSLATGDSIHRALELSGFQIMQTTISEPFWPAPKIGTAKSFSSISNLIFSLTKLLDIICSRIIPSYGTRFFLVAKKAD